jgi:antitoxin (DNA-binding transcriptional repressor) of toxin-antitoxin stability system
MEQGGRIMTIDIRELQQRIDEAIAQSQAGVEVVIVDGDVPKAKIVAVDEPPPSHEALKPRIAGLHPGAFVIADDFDE